MKAADDAVSLMIVREMRPGLEQQYQEVSKGITAAAAAYPGFLAAYHYPPTDDSSHITVLQFDSLAHLQAWECSEERRGWLEEINRYAYPPKVARHLSTGLEFLFAAAPGASVSRPRRYKMALVLTLVIYTLMMTLRPLLSELLVFMPAYVAGLVLVLTQVLLMTYLIMPPLTRALARWLYR